MESAELPSASVARVRLAVLWRSGSQAAGQAVMWASTFLVLRLLDPADYGLFAMTQAAIGIADLLNGFCFASSLIQARRLEREGVGQIFGILIIMNLAIAALQFLAAPIVAGYFHQPRLVALLRVQSAMHLLTPFIILPQALLSRAIDFRTQGRANVLAAIAGAITALVCAGLGLDVWTLIAAPFALLATRVIALGVSGRWWVRPRFRLRGAGALIGFGGTILVADLFWIVQTQADIVIAGRRLDPHVLGLYCEALFLAQIVCNKLVPAINDVAFPAYARMQGDRTAVARGFARAAAAVMLVAMPLYAGLAATAAPLVEAAMGPRWAEAAPIARLLAFAMPFITLHILFPSATNALGRPGIAVRTAAAGALVMPVAFAIGAAHGAIGMAAAWITAAPLLALVSAKLSLPVIGLGATALARAIVPPALAAAAMWAVVTLVDGALPPLAPIPRLALLVPLGILSYAGFAILLARPLVLEALAMARGTPAGQVPAI